MPVSHLAVDLLILLCGAFATGLLFQRLRQEAILGYLVAGFLLGPPVLNLVSEQASVQEIAELGITLLLFVIGLEFSWGKLRAMGATNLLVGVVQITATAAIVFLVCVAVGFELRTAVTLGLVIAPSSTALVLRMLAERGELESIHGRMSLSVLLLQDMAVVPMVIAISGMGTGSTGPGMLFSLGWSVLYLLLFFGALYLFNRYVVKRLLDVSAAFRNSELLLLLGTIIALGSAWLAKTLGISPSLGAFLAGMLLAESPFAAQIRSDIGPFKTLFLTIFFASVGMLANLAWIISNWSTVLWVLIMIVAGKSVLICLIAFLFTRSLRNSLATGLAIAQIGEFSFFLAALGLREGLLDPGLYQLVLSSTVLSLMLSPFLVANALSAGDYVAKRMAWGREEPGGTEDGSVQMSSHVVIVGFGPAGRRVCMALQKTSAHVVLIEFNHQTVAQAEKMGIRAVYGDATREPVLREAHVETSRLVVVTIPDPRSALAVITLARAVAPHVPIVARARYHLYADDLKNAGAEVIVDEEELVGWQLAEETLRRMQT